MSTTAIVLFTRDLRVHDHPALCAAVAASDRVVPLFVLDDALLTSRFGRAANRRAFLRDALRDLERSLEERGGELVVRRGDVAAVVAEVAGEVEATSVHVSQDVSAFAARRDEGLRSAGAAGGFEVRTHPGITAVPAGDVSPSGGTAYQVFSPYRRAWLAAPRRSVLAAPGRIALPSQVPAGRLADVADALGSGVSPERQPGGEAAAHARLAWFLDGPVAAYAEQRNVMAADGTSKLAAFLHFGCLSALDIVTRLDPGRPGHEEFASEVIWREFNHQLLAARPTIPTHDIRPRGDRWREDPDGLQAWKDGRTGYPIVDAAMRQLLLTGWMHNRARMVVASFLTKHLYIDWREGAWHFADWLVDGDVANNFGQWQWVAGTGTDSRPNRMFNPVTQSQRYDPNGDYIRRYVPELAHLDRREIHAPWESLAGRACDYPPPLVDHAEARARFLDARGVGAA